MVFVFLLCFRLLRYVLAMMVCICFIIILICGLCMVLGFPLMSVLLWHSYTGDHRGQLITDAISNPDHITPNTYTPTRMPNTTLQKTSSPDITTVSSTLYNRTSWTTQHPLSSDHLPIITTINSHSPRACLKQLVTII